MESPRAKWVDMIQDRLHALEEDNLALRKELTELKAKVHPLRLLPHTSYTQFSDGYVLYWRALHAPKLLHPETDEIRPLEDAHWQAVAFPGATIIEMPRQHEWNHELFCPIGKAGQITTVKTLVDSFNDWLQQPAIPHSQEAADPTVRNFDLYSAVGYANDLVKIEGFQSTGDNCNTLVPRLEYYEPEYELPGLV